MHHISPPASHLSSPPNVCYFYAMHHISALPIRYASNKWASHTLCIISPRHPCDICIKSMSPHTQYIKALRPHSQYIKSLRSLHAMHQITAPLIRYVSNHSTPHTLCIKLLRPSYGMYQISAPLIRYVSNHCAPHTLCIKSLRPSYAMYQISASPPNGHEGEAVDEQQRSEVPAGGGATAVHRQADAARKLFYISCILIIYNI